ncbi:DUF484 family protein [Crenobacter caeni]|uniref:DUF484 family protein n=1 Tax=Crenobacter caeni TaxID=2705474 RepID=A0A6B2KQT9_9NEIS|nr:DUF484 family protein [Crenobacter caeni]NDV12453.1 DUF484 family protein [Crenobacter caeni]
MQEAQVRAWLQANPDFVREHANLPITLGEGKVLPLSQLQLKAWQGRVAQLGGELGALLERARENEVLLGHLHRLACLLAGADSREACIRTSLACFADTFGLPRAALYLFNASSDPLADYAEQLTEPYCGPYASERVIALLPAGPAPESFALAALRSPDGTAFGLAVFASEDSGRFAAGVATDYLARIAELLSAALWRTRAS